MSEHALREMVRRVQDGRLSRRRFVQTMAEPFDEFEHRCRSSLFSGGGQETLNFL